MGVLVLVAGWLLTWALGVAVLAVARGRSTLSEAPGDSAFVIGCGFFVGQFLVTLWMRTLALASVPFAVTTVGAPVVAVAAIAGFLAYRIRRPAATPIVNRVKGWLAAQHVPAGERMVLFVLLAWLALRFVLLLNEVLQRPLYPWDAWTQWSTKARVWYELKTMVPFVTASDWFGAPGAGAYFDAAPHYPATIPLTQVWSALLLGRWDDALINLPWWLTAVAFGVALYGFFRRQQMNALFALVGVWLVLSLPILDTHVALAGYADLAMGTYFTLAALAAFAAVRTRSPVDWLLALVLGCACVLIKNPGKVWLLMLLPGLVAAAVPRYGNRFAAGCFAVAAILALELTQHGVTLLGYQLKLEYDMPWRGLLDAWFAYANWHLLFYGAAAMAILARRELLSRELAPLTITVAAGLAFLIFGFAFTNARAWVEDQSTVNRATLHLAPLIVVWMLLAFHTWSQAQRGRVDEGSRSRRPSPCSHPPPER